MNSPVYFWPSDLFTNEYFCLLWLYRNSTQTFVIWLGRRVPDQTPRALFRLKSISHVRITPLIWCLHWPVVMTPSIRHKWGFLKHTMNFKICLTTLFKRSVYGCKYKQSNCLILILHSFFTRRRYISDSRIPFKSGISRHTRFSGLKVIAYACKVLWGA